MPLANNIDSVSGTISRDLPARRVLVIDDSPLIRQAATIALERIAGFQVLTAGSAQDGLTIAERECPDAILLDVVMPGMDGITAARRLAASESTRIIPVVLLTAKDEAECRDLLEHVPTAGTIAKPFSVAGLGDQLRGLLGWPA
jgi:CheY-like chemotaxis protein